MGFKDLNDDLNIFVCICLFVLSVCTCLFCLYLSVCFVCTYLYVLSFCVSLCSIFACLFVLPVIVSLFWMYVPIICVFLFIHLYLKKNLILLLSLYFQRYRIFSFMSCIINILTTIGINNNYTDLFPCWNNSHPYKNINFAPKMFGYLDLKTEGL